MVYCVKCGENNSNDATFCVKCGEHLMDSPDNEGDWERRIDAWGEDVGQRAEQWGKRIEREIDDECFSSSHDGAIAGIIVGIIILLLGVAVLANVNIWSYLGPLAVIVVGILLIAGVVYRWIRR
jgi:uncharacterized membrane protein YvbJ